MNDADLTQAQLFDVFSNARRRMAVRYLTECGGSCDLAPLVEQVAAWENDVAREEVTRTQRRRVYISLYQTHLPMLEDHGIVEWDPDGHEIELVPSETAFEPYLDDLPGTKRNWHHVYAAVAVVGVAVATLGWLSVGPVSVAILPFVGLALSAAVFAVAVAHRTARHRSRSLLPTW